MSVPSAPEPRTARPAVVLTVLAVSVCGYSLAATQLLPALPVLQAHFHASASATAWVFTAYTLVAAPATPLVGRMGDMYGRRRLLITVLAVFSCASVASAFAQNLPELIAALAFLACSMVVEPPRATAQAAPAAAADPVAGPLAAPPELSPESSQPFT